MDSSAKTSSDVSETDVVNELEGKRNSAEDGEAPMDTTEHKSENDDSENKDTAAVQDSASKEVGDKASNDSNDGDLTADKQKKASCSVSGDELRKEVSPKKTDIETPVSPTSQSTAVVTSPASSSQKTQTLRYISQQQMASLPIHTIQLPLKSSPIVLKATTIPMPTKTVSIVAKPSSLASPVKMSATEVLPSTSKTPSKAVSDRKSVIGVEKKESVSSSKSERFLHHKVKHGGLKKAKMQSARVIVVPLQITKEMIAAKQKAAKMAKSGSDDAGKRVKERDFKSESADSDEASEASSAKEKNPEKQIKKSNPGKKTEVEEFEEKSNAKSKSHSKSFGKRSGSDETENMESGVMSQEKSSKENKDGSQRTGGIEKTGNKAGNKELKKAEEEKEESGDENEETCQVEKIVKGKIKKKERGSDEAEVKSQEKLKKKEKSEDDSESELDADAKSKIAKGKTPKKTKKKEDDEEFESESDLKRKTKGKAAKKLQRKNESDEEIKDTSDTEQKQDDDDDMKPARKKKTKKRKEEEEERDDDSEDDGKKRPGRPRKSKGEATATVKPNEEPVLSTRRSKRESNLSMKLAEWGLLPVATPKSSQSNPALPRSPVASRSASASKHSAAARSSVASRSPVAADSPMASSEDVSAPTSPGKPGGSGVTVTVIKSSSAADSTPATVESEASSSQPSKADEKQSAKSGAEWLDKASSILGSSSLTKVAPKLTPKVLKAEKSTPGQSAKQLSKAAQEKAIAPKPAVEVKQMQNKSLMCKPIMMTKATSCNPIRIHKITQTEVSEAGRKKKKTVFVPVPVPIALPSPVATCAMPTPFPLPLPVPLPVPCFIPTSRRSIDGLMKSLQELHDQMPSDPFEVDLLTMADAVATAHKEVPDCVFASEEVKPILKVDPNIGVAATTLHHRTSGGELSEDVLEMALRMAQEMPEEGSIELDALKERMARHPEASRTTEFGSVMRNGNSVQHKRASGDKDQGPYKRNRLGGSGGGGLGKPAAAAAAVAFSKGLPVKDSHMKLKYSCGVRAWKQWVKEKNVELEKAAAALKVRSKLFRHEILQCTTEELNLALSLFVREVRKPTGEEYAPDSIYYLCLGIQYYLYENGRVDNIFSDVYYKGFSDTLNNLLSTFQIRLNAQGIIICRITEEHLWESQQLGAHSPYVLLSTLVYLNTKYFLLNSTDAHLALTFTNVVKQFKKNGFSGDAKQTRTAFLRYNATVFTDRGVQSVTEPPVNPSEQLENPDNPLRCPVKLYEFYLSKCPENIRSRSELFYLTPEVSCLPNSPVWYSTVPVSSEIISKMLSRFQLVREIQEALLHNMQPVFG